MTFDEELVGFTRDDLAGGFGPRSYGASVDLVLAYAFAHSDKGRAYVPASGFGVSTVSQVRTSLFADISRLREAERNYFIAKGAEAATYLADAGLIAAIKAAVGETAEDSDYGRNLRVVLAGEHVSGRNVGILASLVKVYARQQQLEAERKAHPVVAGFIGEVGERVRGISGTAKTVVYSEGDYGTTTFLVAITDDGRTVVWNASKALDIEVGDTFTMCAATVKAHEAYHGVDQSVITRPSKLAVHSAAHDAAVG